MAVALAGTRRQTEHHCTLQRSAIRLAPYLPTEGLKLMSRQTQNVLIGGLACVVAAVAMIAATIVLTGGDDSTTTAAEPLAAGQTDTAGEQSVEGFEGTEGENAGGSAEAASAATLPTPRSTLDLVGLASTSTVAESTTSSSDPATTTTVATTAAPTTAAPTTTVVQTSLTTASSSSSTAAEQTTTTAAPGQSSTTAAPTTTATAPPSSETTAAPTTQPTGGGGLNDVEREIARLTNELRQNPNGPLKRKGPVINCGGRVQVDSSNQYVPIAPVALHEVASLQVARPWSAQMSRSNFEHRPGAGFDALQNAGIPVRATGENIAYHNYPNKALNHFEGWRESDGHFCIMMDARYTHLGVGEVTKADGISYATQNYFSLR